MNSAAMRCFYIYHQKESERDVLAEFLIDNPGNSLYYQKVSSAWQSLVKVNGRATDDIA